MGIEIPEVPDLYRLAFMPGVFRCTYCDFQLSKQSMSISTGVIGVSDADRETEECPNDGTMMVPVTYREQLAAYESRLFQELDAKNALQAQLTEAREHIERLQKPVTPEEWKEASDIDENRTFRDMASWVIASRARQEQPK